MTVREFYLEPMQDSRKSFYNKAVVLVQEDGSKILQSYNTFVAKVTAEGELEVYGTYSPTTLRHIKEFMYQNGFDVVSKKEIEALYI
jgi:hypothetical protein